ncbi:MAG: hypothetical protein V4507_12905 [Verrucomicrobiota bacterium]
MILVEQYQIFDSPSTSHYRYRLAARSRNLRSSLIPFPLPKSTGKSGWAHAFQQGLQAVKKNAPAAFIVQSAIAFLVIAYYGIPLSRPIFEKIKELRQSGGYPFCFLLMGSAVAFLVESLQIITRQKGRFQKENRSNFIFTFLIYGTWGIFTQQFFNFQSHLFEQSTGFTAVLQKTSIDRLIWGPFFAIPYQIILNTWRAENYSFQKTFHNLKNWKPIAEKVYFPLLITNEGFWIPMNLLLYCFPLSLQFPVAVLALSLWVLLLNTVIKR